MSLNIDLLTVVIGLACLLAGYTYAVSKQKPQVTDQDLARDLEYHRNLTDSLRQDVADLRKRNNDLLEKNWQLTQTKPK
jgi:uncharacterized protein YlxW (UPF0749 family)